MIYVCPSSFSLHTVSEVRKNLRRLSHVDGTATTTEKQNVIKHLETKRETVQQCISLSLALSLSLSLSLYLSFSLSLSLSYIS
jgi:hypothetical protein